MTLIKSFELSISYSRIYVFNPDVPEGCGLEFEEQHYRQGFAWRPGEANFDVQLFSQVDCTHAIVEVHLKEEMMLAPDSTRAIWLPFPVSKQGVVVADVIGSSEVPIPIPEGHYGLLFELKPRDDPEYLNSPEYQEDLEGSFMQIWCRLTFVPQESVEPAILRVDEYLSPTYPLLMEATPIR